MSLTVETIRALKKQLESCDLHNEVFYLPMAEPQMTVDGVVVIGLSYMHPETFRDIFGDEMYAQLLQKPRIANPFGD